MSKSQFTKKPIEVNVNRCMELTARKAKIIGEINGGSFHVMKSVTVYEPVSSSSKLESESDTSDA